MSLIHDALKKAEHQRQLGKAPTLDTPVFSRPRPRRWILPLLVLLVVAAAMAWVLLWPTTTQSPVLADATAPAKPVAEPKAAKAPVASHGTVARAEQKQSAKPAEGKRQAAAKSLPAKPNQAMEAAGNTPVGKPPATPQPPAGFQKPAKPAGATAVAAPASASKQDAGKPAATAAGAATPSAKPPGFAEARTAKLRREGKTTPAKPGSKANRGKLPMYWDLPYGVRNELPAFEVSMHVYSADPKSRFVILNGERRVAGDELEGGIKLIAIRPDGIEMERDGNRFLVPRDGGY